MSCSSQIYAGSGERQLLPLSVPKRHMVPDSSRAASARREHGKMTFCTIPLLKPGQPPTPLDSSQSPGRCQDQQPRLKVAEEPQQEKNSNDLGRQCLLLWLLSINDRPCFVGLL